tara:strand:- start:346 stop:1161 length:816 start_codon:yes stop_codon:yes gene_type:complete
MSFFSKKRFLIAEAGINHNGNIKEALKLVDAAKKSNVNAIKFQTYITEKRTKKNSPIFKILKKCELDLKEFKIIKDYCDHKKIIFFSTPFDKESVWFLNSLKVKLFKIASFDISNFQLINEIVKTKKPTIISTGMASIKEIKKAYNFFKNKKIETAFLHCISSYPNKEETSYLSNIDFLKKRIKSQVGLSDHTNGIKIPLYAYLKGARIIEKHFKINDRHDCVDGPVSITSLQFVRLIKELDKIDKILGVPKFGIRKEEKNSKQFKRKKII